MVDFLNLAKLSVSQLPSSQIIVHRSDHIESISNTVKNTRDNECFIDYLSYHISLMGVNSIPAGADYFLIKFFAKFAAEAAGTEGRSSKDEHEVTMTRILVKDFTPQMRLDIVQELGRYKKALSSHFAVFSRFSEFTPGLPAGQFFR